MINFSLFVIFVAYKQIKNTAIGCQEKQAASSTINILNH